MAKKASIVRDICPNGYPTMSTREKSLFQQQNNLPNLPNDISAGRCIQKSWIKPNDPNTGGWFDIFQQVTYNDLYYPYISDLDRRKTINNIYSKGNYSDYSYTVGTNTKDQIVTIDQNYEDINKADVLVDINFAVDSVNKIIDNISGKSVELTDTAELIYNKDYDSWGVTFPKKGSILANMSTKDTKLLNRLSSGEMTGYIIILEVEQIDPTLFNITTKDGICALAQGGVQEAADLKPMCPIINDDNDDRRINLKFITICNDIRNGARKMYGDNYNIAYNTDSWNPIESGLFASESKEYLYIACKINANAFSNCVFKRFMIIDNTIYQPKNPREVLHVDFSLPTPIDLVSGKALTAGTYGQYNSQYKYWYKSAGTNTNPIAYIKLSELPVLQNELRNILTSNAKYRIICESYQQSSSSDKTKTNMNILKFGTGSPENASNLAGAFGLADAQINNASTTYNDSTLFRYNVAYRNGTGHDFTTWKNTAQLAASQNATLSYALKELNINQLNNYYLLFGCGNNGNNPGRDTFLKTVIIERL